MAKGLPYFRWYPADAETDELYDSLDDAELGFYHRCLNKSWINNGLPAELDQLAKVMKVSRKYLDKVWVRLSPAWQERDGRLFNRRQEEERTHATTKSERATSSVRTRYERTSNDLPRVRARADSPSESGSEVKEPTEIPKTDFDVRYRDLYQSHIIPGFQQDGEYEYASIVTSAVDPDRKADLIDKAHAEWMAFLHENPEEYRPGIGKWLKDGYYTRSPVRSRSAPSRKLTPITHQALNSPENVRAHEIETMRALLLQAGEPEENKRIYRQRLQEWGASA